MLLGGASLIQSAKINSVINEINQYSTAFNTYYSIYNKVPGSTNNPNCIGECTGKSAFSSITWQDLKDEGLIDKEIQSISAWYITVYGVKSKYGNNSWYWNYEEKLNSDWAEAYYKRNLLFFRETSIDKQLSSLSEADYISIDSKIDDGNYKTGKVMSTSEISTHKSLSMYIIQDVQ